MLWTEEAAIVSLLIGVGAGPDWVWGVFGEWGKNSIILS